ncbi:putative right origin-binding protein [Yersinia frederiksenii]|uniref:Helix-turn-helix domain protein n=2 Tax=Yersinia frederiksenii TaxID=29484 RepID=A0ABR4VXQ0_YERFR|nr:helix-turn-helix domain-containing protein [Yersinia frederiksenii]ATM95635.1 AraC family transcriptional regulator [Yersinia frederiksenii]KGA44632.1 helix-turn-helix domain protein [Yersinia frederiksenii ATCC 33641]SUP75733.1 putative right origin-binding protein [Yersinia frederiksenii]
MIHNEIINSIMLWIDDNVDKPLKISDIAERAGYSKWHLQRVFHRMTEQTIASYIRNKKLESAAKDLITKNETIADIAYNYGYDSQQSFTRSFKKKYNIPPGCWRRHFNTIE